MTQSYNLSQLANNLTSAGLLDAADGLVNAVPIANGGTGASSASAARTNLVVPSTTGTGASGTWNIDITGNAATATALTSVLAVINGGTGVTTSTGTGAVVLGTSPTLTTPTFNSAQLAAVSGTAPLYMCRAWVNFNGQGTVAIRASGNVSSITDNGTGDFTINFTTAMPDANYAACPSLGPTAGTVSDDAVVTTLLAGSVRIQTSYLSGTQKFLSDYSNTALSVFR